MSNKFGRSEPAPRLAPKPRLSDVVTHLQQIAPLTAAEPWDNVGLLTSPCGNPMVHSVLIALDLTRTVWADCCRRKTNLLICYHPPIFKPLIKWIPSGDTAESLAMKLFHAGTSIYSPHTALDVAEGGTNDVLAATFKLKRVRSMTASRSAEPQFKLLTFVPANAVETVAAALFATGAGCIGKNSRYTSCSFRTPGEGTFRGDETTHPAVGKKGRLEVVPEIRWETVVGQSVLGAAIDALQLAHPYEEPAYDVIPLANPQTGPGMGRLGELSEPMRLDHLAQYAKRRLRIPHVQIAGRADGLMRTCALVAGSGGKMALDAWHKQPFDVLITGELKHHDLLAYRAAGINVLLLGHAASETPVLSALAENLQHHWPMIRVTATTPDPLTLVLG